MAGTYSKTDVKVNFIRISFLDGLREHSGMENFLSLKTIRYTVKLVQGGNLLNVNNFYSPCQKNRHYSDICFL
jgi:hypothetical protein